MRQHHISTKHQQGAGLIEVLVTLVILMLGLLGLVGLIVQSQRSQTESYQRVQAVVLLEDMVNRINTNRKVATCYVITTTTSGTPYLGTGSTVTPACATGTAGQNTIAMQDMTDWSNALKGSGEVAGGANVGAMIGARGCVELVSAGVGAGAGVYRVTVVWQGNAKTAAPAAAVACGSTLYGDEAQRRAISVNVQIASLS